MAGTNNETLHAQVRQYILDKIRQESLKPGDILPSEAELESLLCASRTTIRAALIDLQHEGYIIRKQGKGTFVADTTYEEQLTRLKGFTEDAEARGKKVTSVVVSLDTILPAEEVARKLQLADGEPITKLVRVRYVDGEPTQLSTSYLSPQISRKIDFSRVDFSKDSLYRTIEALGFPISDGDEVMELSFADTLQAGLLQVAEGFPLFTTIRLVMGKNGRPLEYSVSYTRGDRHRAHIHLKR
ncbi:MAG: GntR family transcriptional regulator [Clostridia bacterium]|nr:GntR family transcriptional regulator [Clostridia bacterium]